MRYGRLLISLACLVAACGGATFTPALTATPQPDSFPPPAASATPLPGSSPIPSTPALAGFRILSPQDEAVVNVPEVEVGGEAKPDTVITLNDEIVVVDQSGTFSVKLPLDEGPNTIEVVASDSEGHEVSFELEVTYDPES